MTTKDEQQTKLDLIKQLAQASLYIQYIKRYEETKNPAYLWECITICIENELPLPEICKNYLLSISNSLVYEDHGEEKLPSILKKSLCLKNKTQLNEVRVKKEHIKQHSKVADVMVKNRISKDKALDELKITASGSLDKYFNSNITNAYRNDFFDVLEQFKIKTIFPLIGDVYLSLYDIGNLLIKNNNSKVLLELFSDLCCVVDVFNTGCDTYKKPEDTIKPTVMLQRALLSSWKKWEKKEFLTLEILLMLKPILSCMQQLDRIIQAYEKRLEKSELFP